jgi:uncharacterized repeat protein (TIGR01451 family)/fimbrial isopeptide formation D2 family protein
MVRSLVAPRLGRYTWIIILVLALVQPVQALGPVMPRGRPALLKPRSMVLPAWFHPGSATRARAASDVLAYSPMSHPLGASIGAHRPRLHYQLAQPSLSKQVSTATATVGQTFTYTLIFTIPAGISISNVALEDELPTWNPRIYVEADSAVGPTPINGPALSPTATVSYENHSIAWDLPDINNTSAAAYTYRLTYRAQVDTDGSVGTNHAVLRWDGGSSDAQVDVTIVKPDVHVQRIASTADGEWAASSGSDTILNDLRAGEAITITVLVTNVASSSASPAYNVRVLDILPAWIQYESVIAGFEPITEEIGSHPPRLNLEWMATTRAGEVSALDVLDVGEVFNVTYRARVASDVSPGMDESRKTEVNFNILPPVTGSDRTVDSGYVRFLSPDVLVTKTAQGQPPDLGKVRMNETVTYTIVYTLPGGTTLDHAASFEDRLEDGLQYLGLVSHPAGIWPTPTQSTEDGYTSLQWDLPAPFVITDDLRHTYVISARVSPTRFLESDAGELLVQGEELINTAIVSWYDQNNDGHSVSDGTSVWLVRPQIVPDKGKAAPQDQFGAAGVPVRFEIGDVWDAGNEYAETAYHVIITDALPSDWTYVDSQPSGAVGTVNGQTVITWGPTPILTAGLYLPGLSQTAASYVITATPPATVVVGAPYTNTVYVSYANDQDYYYLGRDDLTIRLPLSLSKTVTPASPFLVGETITYSLTGVVPPHAVLYWPHQEDALPGGVRYTGWYETQGASLVTGPITNAVGGSETVEWWWNSLDNTASNTPMTFTFRFNAALTGLNTDDELQWQSYRAETAIENTSVIEWNSQNIGGTYPLSQQADRSDGIIQPFLLDSRKPPAKSLIQGGPLVESGDLVTYSLIVYNTGQAPAYDVLISDTLPPGMAFHSYQASVYPVSAPSYVPTVSSEPLDGQQGVLTWVFDEVAAGDGNYRDPTTQMMITATLRVSDSVGAGAVLVNEAQISDYSSLPGDQPLERHYAYLGGSPFTAGPVSVPEGHITKSTAITRAALGEQVVFSISVPSPTLSATLYNATVTDRMPTAPAGTLHVLAATAPGASSLSVYSDVVSATFDLIPAHTQATLLITARVPVTAGGGLVQNAAAVQWEDAPSGGDVHNAVSDPAEIQITAPEIALDKSAPAAVHAGAPLIYMLTYQNEGLVAARDVRLTDTLPVSVTLVGFSADRPITPTGPGMSPLVWEAGDLAPGESGTLWITVTVPVTTALGAHIVNTATIGTSSPGDDPLNNQDTTSTIVGGALLGIAKTATPDPVRVGGEILYTLTVTNTGVYTTQNLLITDRVPASTTLVRVGPGGAQVGDVVSWDQYQLAPGKQAIMTFAVRVDSTTVSGTQIVNARYGATADNAAPTSDEKPVTVTVQAAILEISKMVTPNPVPAGELLHYTLTVSNTGVVQAAGVVVSDQVPMSTTFDSASPGSWLSGGAVHWGPFEIEVGERAVVTFSAQVPDSVISGTFIVNEAYGAQAADAGRASGEPVTATVFSYPLLFVEKTGPPVVTQGEDMVYAIRYGNAGNAIARDVQLVETYDANTTFLSADPNPTMGNDLWQVAELEPGADHTLVITVRVGERLPYGSHLTNTVEIDSDETEPQQATASTLVGGSLVYLPLCLRGYEPVVPPSGPNLIVQDIQIGPNPPTVGEATRITVTLHNAGTGAISDDFWVDLYVDPTAVPTVDVLWNDIAPFGKAWFIHQDIAGGEDLIIHTDQPDDPADPDSVYSNWPGWFVSPGDHILYVQADAFGLPAGAIAETDETDNVYGPQTVTVKPNAGFVIPPSVQWRERR